MNTLINIEIPVEELNLPNECSRNGHFIHFDRLLYKNKTPMIVFSIVIENVEKKFKIEKEISDTEFIVLSQDVFLMITCFEKDEDDNEIVSVRFVKEDL